MHFRLTDTAKLVVGRNEQENQRLLDLAKNDDYLFMPSEIAGPTALGKGIFSDDLIQFACGIISRYSDLNGSKEAGITYRRIPEADRLLEALPIEENKLMALRV